MDAKIYILYLDPFAALQERVLPGVSVEGIIHVELASTHHVLLRPRRVLLCLVATTPLPPHPHGRHAPYGFPLSPFILLKKTKTKKNAAIEAPSNVNRAGGVGVELL